MNNAVFEKLKKHKISYSIGNDYGYDYFRVWKRKTSGKINDKQNDSIEFVETFNTLDELIRWFDNGYKQEANNE